MEIISGVTELLHAMERGQTGAEGELLQLVYDELHRIAHAQMRRAAPGQTLQPTALVNEAYLQLLGQDRPSWENRRHFLFVAARAMRDILLEQARRKATAKRGGAWRRATPIEPARIEIATEVPAEDMLALEEALTRLEQSSPRKAQLVHLRFFAGLSEKQTAGVLGVSERTVQREWCYTRAWLYRELEGAKTTSHDHLSRR